MHEIFAIECRLQQSKSRLSTFNDICTSVCQIAVPSWKWLFFCYWLVYCENGCR